MYSSITLRRSFATCSVCVLMLIPSSTGVVHEAGKPLLPSISTTHNLQEPNDFKESLLFEKRIFNKSKGLLKLLDVGELSTTINIEVSYASKKAIEKVEKNGGKVNLIKDQ